MAKPFVKWAGGKHASIEHILKHLPERIGTYYEPLVGGGAVFFALANAGRFERAVINDSCDELMGTYVAIRDDVEGVIAAIRKLRPSRITEAKYLRVRSSRPRTPAGRAARMLFLNKTGFNGLYRLNSFGKFNVPWGKRTKWVPDVGNLRAVSEVLRSPDVVLRCGDFAAADRQLDLFGSDEVHAYYLDPPYLPASKIAKFTSYSRYGFGYTEQQRLAALFSDLAHQGVHVVASNADVPATLRLYGDIEGTEFLRLHIGRAINCNGKSRGKVGELLMVNPGKE
jgi:DNA adenine methylase